MINVKTHPSFDEKQVFFGVVEARFPEPEHWDLDAFEALKEKELAELR